MGHDITAITDYDEYMKFWNNPRSDFSDKEVEKFRDKNQVAYLRRSMYSETIKYLYDFLGCANNYNGCSGDGNHIVVNLKELKRAKERVDDSDFDEEDKEDYSEFLINCILYCEDKNKEGVIIKFG